MDPKEVKLTTRQKIKPLLIAINKEIPWQMVVLTGLGLWAAIVVPTYLPVFFNEFFWDILIRRILVGILAGVVAFFAGAFVYAVIFEKIIEVIGKIRSHYDEESLKVKKEVLDNAEVDMLRK